MNDLWGSFQNFMNSFRKMMNNPQQFVISQFGIPQEIANDPNKIIQKMMSDGRLSQSQYNAARYTAQQIQNNPMFGQFMK